MKSKSFHLISLGCAKNTVDSDSMAQLLMKSGYRPASADKAEVLLVNTCGFIGPARDESLQALAELAAQKRPRQLLIAAGCLTQRYGQEVAKRVPGIDGIIGTRRWMDILDLIQRLRSSPHPQPLYHLPDSPTVGSDEGGVLRASVHGGSAYLKIADGCRRPCAFCAIPLIKGTAVSRPMHTILDEARRLQDAGVVELILIAQDTTDYGHDLGMRDGLAELLEHLVVAAPAIEWIRIMYAYPGYVSDRLIDVMASHAAPAYRSSGDSLVSSAGAARITPYLDMPLQHAHPATLRRMRRPANVNWVYRMLDKLRSALPHLALRTTFIVGYPGETEDEFQTLYNFIEEIRFDRIGVFKFSFEEGTPSEPLGDPIPEEVKEERYQRLMERQQAISLEKNLAFVGKTLDVLIEGAGDGISVGRSYRDAPEIDGLVIVESEVPIGKILPVQITGAMTYDLSGTLANAPASLRFPGSQT